MREKAISLMTDIHTQCIVFLELRRKELNDSETITSKVAWQHLADLVERAGMSGMHLHRVPTIFSSSVGCHASACEPYSAAVHELLETFLLATE